MEMGNLIITLLLAVLAGCTTVKFDDVQMVNDEAVYRLGENTVIDNILYQTRDGEWVRYEKPVLFPKGYFIGKGPED